MLICSVLCFSWSRYGNILCSSVNKLQQNYLMYSTKIDCLVEDSSGLHFTYVTVCLLSASLSNSLNSITTMLLDQSELRPDSGQIINH